VQIKEVSNYISLRFSCYLLSSGKQMTAFTSPFVLLYLLLSLIHHSTLLFFLRTQIGKIRLFSIVSCLHRHSRGNASPGYTEKLYSSSHWSTLDRCPSNLKSNLRTALTRQNMTEVVSVWYTYYRYFLTTLIRVSRTHKHNCISV
jgi:hypothetical protein